MPLWLQNWSAKIACQVGGGGGNGEGIIISRAKIRLAVDSSAIMGGGSAAKVWLHWLLALPFEAIREGEGERDKEMLAFSLPSAS